MTSTEKPLAPWVKAVIRAIVYVVMTPIALVTLPIIAIAFLGEIVSVGWWKFTRWVTRIVNEAFDE